MKKISLEIVIPIYNEGEKVIKLLEQFQIIIKIQFRVLLCYDLEDDNIFNEINITKMTVAIKPCQAIVSPSKIFTCPWII